MYDDLERLAKLRDKGAITEEEYQKEKLRILDAIERKSEEQKANPDKKNWGMDVKSFCSLMHISQFAGLIFPFAGFILPIVMWQVGKENSETIDKHGRMITNWLISFCIYTLVASILCVIFIGIPLVIALGIIYIIFAIKGSIKANEGALYTYPMSMKFV